MMNVKTTLVMPLAIASLLAGCRYDGTDTKMQWAPDMADSPATKAQRSYLDPPEGSVPMRSIFYPKSNTDAETQLSMPEQVARNPQGEAKGKELFDTFCIPCHGADAKGGSIHPAIVPPDLTHPVYRDHKDGFFFYTITFGHTIMPSYGHAISPDERWYIVRYLRALQGKGGK